MADKTKEVSSASNTGEESSKWQAYWDENYKRYYWSDGHESVNLSFDYFSFILVFILGMGTTKRLY